MNIIYPGDRQELRRWFEENASTEKEVFVHCIRRVHESIMPYLDVVEEALCFGGLTLQHAAIPMVRAISTG